MTAKETMTKIVLSQPDDATYDEILRELAMERMIERGLDDARNGCVISNENMERHIREWAK